jgi:CheY-like chemotaxis protein
MQPGEEILVVIVEDDLYSIEILGQFLELLDIKYHVLADIPHILDEIDVFSKVDAIFVDLELATLNGYEVLQTIRSNIKWDLVPVVAYTSNTHLKSQAREVGFHSFLGKPLNSEAFPEQLRNILNDQPVWE